MEDVCLVIIFNHRYENNISKLNKFYGHRFNNIKILMPFYKNKNDEKIITVYENSVNFQGYIAQAYSELTMNRCKYYVFIGDDCLLNSEINQNNIIELLNLDENSSFISGIQPLAETSLWWPHFSEKNFGFLTPGVEYKKEIPDKETALKMIRKHELFENLLESDFLVYKTVNGFFKLTQSIYEKLYRKVFHKRKRVSLKSFPKTNKILPFPLIMGYSDFFIVNNEALDYFTHLCGVFSSMRMFVEIAIPTSLTLASEKLVTLDKTNFKAEAFWGDSRKDKLEIIKNECSGNANHLFLGERRNILYFHPIKLSSWEVK